MALPFLKLSVRQRVHSGCCTCAFGLTFESETAPRNVFSQQESLSKAGHKPNDCGRFDLGPAQPYCHRGKRKTHPTCCPTVPGGGVTRVTTAARGFFGSVEAMCDQLCQGCAFVFFNFTVAFDLTDLTKRVAAVRADLGNQIIRRTRIEPDVLHAVPNEFGFSLNT